MAKKELGGNVSYLSAFDLDHTLLSCNSSFAFGRYLYKNKAFSLIPMLLFVGCYFAHKARLLSIKKLHRSIFLFLFKGKEKKYFSHMLEDFLSSNLQKMLANDVANLLEKARSESHQLALLSSGPDFIVEAIANKLNISLWLATEYTVDKKGCFNAIEELVQGEEKAEALKKMAHNNGNCFTIAYSDSVLDAPFLAAANKAVAVRPDRHLSKLSVQNGWIILT